ncbi:MAG: YkgJ family cysteine cluster protein [Spirochaetales bacterium]|nr:YkgJ family cysteine cluster protein [Spirochaetales bacterium]
MDTSAPCRFLDPDTHLCTVYQERFTMCRDCKKLTVFHALFSPYLPADCGYVQAFRLRYVLPRALSRVFKRLVGTGGSGSTALRRSRRSSSRPPGG